MKNNHKGFIIPLLIIIVAAVAIGGGAYIYTQKKSTPITTDTTINNTIQVRARGTASTSNENVNNMHTTIDKPANKPIATTSANVQTKTTVPLPTNTIDLTTKTDCGTSNLLSTIDSNDYGNARFQDDAAFNCMGKNILNGCFNSHATIVRGQHGESNVMEVKGTVNDCKINIVDLTNEGANIMCPVSKVVSLYDQGKTANGMSLTEIKSKPGLYGGYLYLGTAFSLFPNEVTPYCTGSALTH